MCPVFFGSIAAKWEKRKKYKASLKHPGNHRRYGVNNQTPLEMSPLQGRCILFLGSSVTNGSGALGCSMVDYLAQLDRCTVVKEAVNGTTLAGTNGQSYFSRLKCVDKRQRFDAVVVQLSTNDATRRLPLGKISTTFSAEGLDLQTVTGAMEAIIAYIRDIWGCPVLFYTGTRFDSPEYQAMVDVLLRLREKWGIRIIDLWNMDTMCGLSEETYALYMRDPIHPTQAGYLLWWLPVFQQQLYALFSG